MLEIVPEGESMIVEAQVAVDGINDMYIGEGVNLRFTAFHSRTTPVVRGTVAYVSANALADKNGMPYYMVKICPDPASLKAAEIKSVQPGMAADVFILTE